MSNVIYELNLSIFAERLTDFLFETNLTPPKFSKIMGCGRATINRYTMGNKMPTVEMLVQMADFFQCSIDYLIGIDDENFKQTFYPCAQFKDRLPELLTHFSFSRYKLQKLSGISESTLYYWSIGKTKPTIDKLIKIAEIFDCSIDFILGRTKS